MDPDHDGHHRTRARPPLLVHLRRAGIVVHVRRAHARRAAGPFAHVVAALEIILPRARPERAAVLPRRAAVLHVFRFCVYSVARMMAAHLVRRLPILAGVLDREGAVPVVPRAGRAEEQQQQGRVAPHGSARTGSSPTSVDRTPLVRSLRSPRVRPGRPTPPFNSSLRRSLFCRKAAPLEQAAPPKGQNRNDALSTLTTLSGRRAEIITKEEVVQRPCRAAAGLLDQRVAPLGLLPKRNLLQPAPPHIG